MGEGKKFKSISLIFLELFADINRRTGIVKFLKLTLAPGMLFLALDQSDNELPHFFLISSSPRSFTYVDDGRFKFVSVKTSNLKTKRKERENREEM